MSSTCRVRVLSGPVGTGLLGGLAGAVLGQVVARLLHLRLEVGDGEVELGALLLHRGETDLGALVGAGDLGHALVADVVEVQQLTDLVEREAEALALQDQLETALVALGESTASFCCFYF